jgi:hypothetical protein
MQNLSALEKGSNVPSRLARHAEIPQVIVRKNGRHKGSVEVVPCEGQPIFDIGERLEMPYYGGYLSHAR